MKHFSVIFVWFGLVLLSLDVHAAPRPLPDREAVVQLGFASRETTVDDPMRLVISEKDPADPSKLIQRDIAVTDIPKYQRPQPILGETPRQYAQRVIAAQEAHSKLKAERIAAAINTALGNGRASVSQVNTLANTGSPLWNVLMPGDAQPTPIRNGQVTVTGAHGVTYGPSAALIKARNDDIRAARAHNAKPENRNNQVPVPPPLRNNHTGEVGDGVRIQNGQPVVPPPGSSRYRTGMSTMNLDLAMEFPGEYPDIPMIATGVDDEGISSVFEFGILDRYVASLHPLPGQTDHELYILLESLLDSNGLPATYDPLTRTLWLDEEFNENDTLYWANNDTGFGHYLRVSYELVPEPSSLLLAMAGAALLGRRRWCR